MTSSVSITKAVKQYLARYAEPETHLLNKLNLDLQFDFALVIPAYKEHHDFITKLTHGLMDKHSILLILVINQPLTGSTQTDALNEALYKDLVNSHTTIWQQESLTLLGRNQSSVKPTSAILLVDRFTSGRQVNPKQGVGLCRKIGADLACHLISEGKVLNPWIANTDADAVLPEDYFSAFNPSLNHSLKSGALCFPFQHERGNTPVHRATALYERAINYYVEGLTWAGSPYAYHSVGSSLGFHFEAYCQARGFPKRAGGEDFYLLNKIAKSHPIGQAQTKAIQLQARLSDRVPFGTGPAVTKILHLMDRGETYCYYHPECFSLLKHWLGLLPQIAEMPTKQAPWHQTLPTEIHACMEQLEIDKILQHLRRQKMSQQQAIKHLHLWFDGFKTLRFIKLLSRSTYPSMPLDQAIETLRQ